MRVTVPCLTALALLALSSQTLADDAAASAFQPSALQTGPDSLGSSFAASAYYNAADQSVWVVGSTYGTAFSPSSPISSDDDFRGGCFFASINVTGADGIQWKQKQTFAMPGVEQSCTNMLIQSSQRVLATGYAQQGNALNDQYEPGGYNDVAQFGMVVDLAFNPSGSPFLTLQGGHLMQESTITYPVDIDTQAGDNYAYILSMETSEDVSAQDGGGATQQDPARFFRYGSSQYGMVVTQVSLTPESTSSSTSMSTEYTNNGNMQVLGETWRKFYATNTGATVHAAGLLKVSDDILLAVGTTSGHGDAFGKDAMSGDDLDGFITKINPATGKMAGSWDDPSNLASVRLQSMNRRDDWVSGLCHNPRDSSSIYVVGATKGRIDPDAPESMHSDSVQAFVMKVNVYTLTPTWIRQLPAPDSDQQPSSVRASACTVTPDGGSIYFGGIVENGSVLSLSGTQTSFGGDDVFVAKLDASNGALKFVRQFGSETNDEIAMRGGLSTDSVGNAIVVGNTFGSLYRTRGQDEDSSTQQSDVFVATIGAFNGKLVLPVRLGESDLNSDSDESDQSGEAGEIAEPKWAGIFFIFFGIIAAATCMCCIIRRRREREVATDRKKVLDYIGDFDVEDVDLKHSATGGWHCSYAGPLAHGINNKSRFRRSFSDYVDQEVDITSPLTDAADYADSLFMTASETPRLRSAVNIDDGGLSFTESLSQKQNGARGGWGRDII
ncbi:hypothetical protein MPSEU_000741500 [Mayamaea pseudoterrestris]|nr:hypothetical protein MPSEU_000741500 [Mayamaea pseudoterrestris]